MKNRRMTLVNNKSLGVWRKLLILPNVLKHLTMLEEEILLKDLKDYEKNAEWFNAKYTEIVKKYEGKTVAVKGQRIVAVKATLDETLKEFELEKEDIGSIYIATIPEKAIAFIL